MIWSVALDSTIAELPRGIFPGPRALTFMYQGRAGKKKLKRLKNNE